MITLNSKHEKLEWKDISFKNIKAFLRFKLLRKLGGLTEDEMIPWAEMMVYKSIMCAECVEDGACLKSRGGCGCSVPGMHADLSKPCGRTDSGEGKFPAFEGTDWVNQWEKYKKDKNFILQIKQF